MMLAEKLKHFVKKTYLIPFIGAELEFYLLGADLEGVGDFAARFLDGFAGRGLLYDLEKERGSSQFEMKFCHSEDVCALCEEIVAAKEYAISLAREFSLEAVFVGRPFVDDCGSALQINLSLHDKNGDFVESAIDGAIAGLLLSLDAKMTVYAPDFARFERDYNISLHQKGKFTAPINKSYGFDNRTCAIRVIKGERIEFRVPSADADPFAVLDAVLDAVLYGLESDLKPGDAIYGNAFDYDLCRFPH